MNPSQSPETSTHGADTSAESRRHEVEAVAADVKSQVRELYENGIVPAESQQQHDALLQTLGEAYNLIALSPEVAGQRFAGVTYEKPTTHGAKIKLGADNQDRGYFTGDEGIVIDGAGGEGDGDRVAESVVETFQKSQKKLKKLNGKSDDTILSGVAGVFEDARLELKRRKELEEDDPEFITRRASGAGGFIKVFKNNKGEEKLAFALKGDVALIVERPDGTIERIGIEETKAAELARQTGTYTPGYAHLIQNSVDAGEGFAPENIGLIPIQDIKRVVLCSDGLENAIVDPRNGGGLPLGLPEAFKGDPPLPQVIANLNKLHENLGNKADDKFVIAMERRDAPANKRNIIGKEAVTNLMGSGREKLVAKRQERQKSLGERRAEVQKQLEELILTSNGEVPAGFMDVRDEAIASSLKMQHASRRDISEHFNFLRTKTEYKEALKQLNLENWDEDAIRRFRILDSRDAKLRRLEQSGFKGAALEFIGNHKIITAIGGIAVGAVLGASVGVIAGATGIGAGAAGVTAGSMAAYRAARSYSTVISGRYTEGKVRKGRWIPGFMEQDGREDAANRRLKTLALGIAAFVGMGFATMIGEKAGVISPDQKNLLRIASVAPLFLMASSILGIKRDVTAPLVHKMGGDQRAEFIANNMKEMVDEDVRTRRRALGFTAASLVIGITAAELLHGAFSGGDNASANKSAAAPETQPSKAPETPLSTPPQPSPAPTQTIEPSPSPSPPVESSPDAGLPSFEPLAPGTETEPASDPIDLTQAVEAIADNPEVATIARNSGMYDQIDQLIKVSPEFQNTHLSANQYNEVMMRAGRELQHMHFANGDPVAYPVRNSAGNIVAYGFGSSGQLPPAANEVLLRHIAEVKGFAVSNSPSMTRSLLDNVDFANSVEQAQVQNEDQLQNLFPKMAELKELGVTPNDYGDITAQLTSEGFTFPSNGHLSHGQLEHIVRAAANQKGFDLRYMHNLITTHGGSVESLMSNIPKDASIYHANQPLSLTLERIPQLQPLSMNLQNQEVINAIGERLSKTNPELVQQTQGQWLFRQDGKLTQSTFHALLRAADPNIRDKYSLVA